MIIGDLFERRKRRNEEILSRKVSLPECCRKVFDFHQQLLERSGTMISISRERLHVCGEVVVEKRGEENQQLKRNEKR